MMCEGKKRGLLKGMPNWKPMLWVYEMCSSTNSVPVRSLKSTLACSKASLVRHSLIPSPELLADIFTTQGIGNFILESNKSFPLTNSAYLFGSKDAGTY